MSDRVAGEGIAVLIPVLNEAGGIGALLDRLLAMDFAEIVVADGGSVDGTADFVRAREGVRLVTSRRGRGVQINAAARTASQPILLVLHADTRLPADAPMLIRSTLRKGAVAGCFRMGFDRPSWLLALYGWFTRFETGFTTFGDQAYFMRREEFEAVGGAPDWPLLEDVALRERLRARGRFVKRPERVVTSARRFVQRGMFFQQARNLVVLTGYYCGVPVARLAAVYGSAK